MQILTVDWSPLSITLNNIAAQLVLIGFLMMVSGLLIKCLLNLLSVPKQKQLSARISSFVALIVGYFCFIDTIS